MKLAKFTIAIVALALTPPLTSNVGAGRQTGAPHQACVVTVAAASDLSYAMSEIAASFEKEKDCHVRASFGSSGNFLAQIENGAPFNLFFSADVDYPKKLESEGLAARGSTYVYALGKIVLWTRNDSGVDVSKGFAALASPAIRKVAIANPQHAPYGRAAEEALKKAGAYESVKARLVLGENISQAAQFVESGNAEVGIIALSLALSPALKQNGTYWRIPEHLYAPIRQGAALINSSNSSSQNSQAAQAFLDYIKTPPMTALLERYGFALPGRTKQ